MSRRDNDIKAPDGYLLGGKRRVLRDGTLLFHRAWWRLPANFAEPGGSVWVHCLDGQGNFHEIEVAPPEYDSFYAAQSDRATIFCPRTERADAKPGCRRSSLITGGPHDPR